MKRAVKYILILAICAMGICGCQSKAETSDVKNTGNASAEEDEVFVEEDAGGSVDFSGSYTEPDSGRCLIEISKEMEGSYTITVNWANGASEERIWAITGATYKDTGDTLYYEDALCYNRTTDDEGNFADEDIYSDGSGIFWMTEGGMLGWKSNQPEMDGVDGELQFERMYQ